MKSKILYIFFILIILFKGYFFSTKYVSDNYYKDYTLKVESIKEITKDKVSYYVRLNKDKFILNIYEDSYEESINLTDYTTFKYGDIVKVKGKIIIPTLLNNPGEFNYKLYLYSTNIHGIISTYSEVEKIANKVTLKDKIFRKIYSFKKSVEENLNKSLGTKEASLAMSLVYGESSNLEESIKTSFSNIGISHLMSVSGTHIASVLLLVNMFFKKKTKKVKVKAILGIILMIMYVTFTGFSLSSVRALFMTSITMICKSFHLQISKCKIFSITFILMLLYVPFGIFNLGFQLSFLSVFGIYLFHKYINRLLLSKVKVKKDTILFKILKYIITCVSLTISVKFVILPLEINSFNRISFPIIISNVLIGALCIPIRSVGMLGVIFSFVPQVSFFLFTLLKPFISLIYFLVTSLNSISFEITVASLPTIFICVYYILIFCIYLLLKLKNIKGKNKSKYNLQRVYLVIKKCCIFLFASLIVSIVMLNIYFKNYSKEVYFFNVEQGDMSYIKYGDESIIVDIGSLRKGLAANVISAYFKKYNLNSVDVIIISHLHTDHVNGLEEFVKNFDVGMVVFANPEQETETYTKLVEMLEKNNIAVKEVLGESYINLENIKIQILLPDVSYIESDNLNTNSIICKVTAGDKNILYMGDADKASEEKLMDKYQGLGKIDILKVGHHGSKTSTTSEFVEYVNPKHSVISAKKKYYGHPHESVLENLRNFNVMIHITEKVGAIKFSLN